MVIVSDFVLRISDLIIININNMLQTSIIFRRCCVAKRLNSQSLKGLSQECRPLVFSCALLFADKEGPETEEQKAGLLEEEMEEKLAGLIAGEETQAAFG